MLNWIAGGLPKVRGCAGPEQVQAGDTRPGLLAGTRVATPEGWRAVETLCAGEAVLTFDGGAQLLRSVSRRLCPRPGEDGPQRLLRLPAGLIGNRTPLTLLPGQEAMLESDLAEAVWGDPFALMRAAELTAVPGVEEMLSEEPVIAVTLGFDADEVVFTEGQALMHCESAARATPWTLDDAVSVGEPRYRVLQAAEARMLAEALREERAQMEAAVLMA